MNSIKRTSSTTSIVRKVDEFFVDQLLSKSHFSNVYSGYHNISHQRIAMKIISKKKMRGVECGKSILFAETKIAPFLQHPHIVKTLKCFENVTSYFQVSEFYTSDLLTYLTTCTPSYEQKLSILDQILSAIEYLHIHNLCHRDIKLDNILMNDDGDVFLSDFGFSAFSLPNVSGYLGSDGYTAPEVISKKGNSYNGIEADLWSTGVLIYAIFANRLPFEKTRDASKLDPLRVNYSLLSPEIEHIVRQLLIVDPKRRSSITNIRYDSIFNVLKDREMNFDYIPEYNDETVKEIAAEIFDEEDISSKLDEVGMNPEKSMYKIIDEQVKESIRPFYVSLSLPVHDMNYSNSTSFDDFGTYQCTVLSAIRKAREYFIYRNYCVSQSKNGGIVIIRNNITDDTSITINVAHDGDGKTSIHTFGNDEKEIESFVSELSSCFC